MNPKARLVAAGGYHLTATKQWKKSGLTLAWTLRLKTQCRAFKEGPALHACFKVSEAKGTGVRTTPNIP